MSGKGSARVSVAGLVCVRPGQRTRRIYRTVVHHGRKNENKGFSARDFKLLLQAAHQQLRAPLLVVWDNLNTHICSEMRTYIDDRDWLTVFQFPAYALELNPARASGPT
ncbi:transposase [Streptosporangiaceae bacterium NEAU-GS5]|nr:transposase [Streptosporangiaceae bacterium NEAU-GS5]